ncbi:MAG TPA: (Fe-S)-binding protein [Candidatus Binataceae bacterium]|nr:(Fe-S)-binding protein [Candidatus Binataceae bacterium]
MITGIIFTLCILASVGVFFYQLWRRFLLLLSAEPASRFDRIPERVRAVIVWAFGQRKFVRRNSGAERSAGWMHFFIFWGFFILAVQILTMFGRAYSDSFVIPGFSLNLLGGPYLLLRDLTEVAVLIAVGVGLVRWGITHAPRLYGFLPPEARVRAKSHWEAYLILIFIGLIMAAGLVYDGGRIVSHPNDMQLVREARWAPLSTLVGLGLASLLGTSFALQASNVAWWVHNLVVLVFLDFLPPSKHFHIITAIPNIFFAKLEPKGQLSKQDLENASRFGTSHIDQFTWKQVLDMFSCTECGRCSSHCPATASKKPLAPRQLLLDLRDYLYQHQDEMIEKRYRAGKGDGGEPAEVGENIVGPVIHDDTLWSCTTCRACEEACPPMIEYVDKIVDMRRHLVQEEARFPKELTRTFKNMETQSNPWGLDATLRFEWAEGMKVPTLADRPDAEFLYYVGCAGAFDDRNKKTTQAFVRVLQKAGVDFACLAQEELCNGETARRLGNEYLYQSMAQMLVEILNNYKVRKIIVNCPHCFNTIKNEYPQFGGSYEVIHAADLVRQLIAAGRLKISAEFSKRTVYHDSCYYGRYNDVFDEPRTVLDRAGAQVVEMQRHHKFGMCCGAGGGRMWLEEDPDKRVNLLRTEQALQTDPEVIAVSCPYCMTMLGDGIKAKQLEEKVQTLDVMEIVDRVTRSGRDPEP